MNAQALEALVKIVGKYGAAVAANPQQLRGLLRDFCPDCTREIRWLVTASEEGVPQALANRAGPALAAEVRVQQQIQRFADATGFGDHVARWAVESWALAFGVIRSGGPRSAESANTAAGNGEVPATSGSTDVVAPDQVEARITITSELDGRPVEGALITVNGHPQEDRTPITFELHVGQTYDIVVTRDAVVGARYTTAKKTVKVEKPGVFQWCASIDRVFAGPRVPEGFNATQGTMPEPYTNTGWAKEIVHEQTGMEMVYVPAGTFMMGSPAREQDRDDGERRHQVTLTKGFYLGKYEVTQEQWRKVTGHNPSHFKKNGKNGPVEQVSWEDCQEFCCELGGGFRLPTEAEWEYACRAGTTGLHAGELDEMGWYGANSNGSTHRVGQRKPNAWGLYDMHGNVSEWCQDDYGEYPRGSATDPAGPNSGSDRVIRGGSWTHDAWLCRSAFRLRRHPGVRSSFVGLRLLMVVSP